MSVNMVRIFFTKSGRAIYTSHLDLTRAMSRALCRSGLPVWYTEGFHPHLYMTFALPLSLGTTGLCEAMEVKMLEDVPYEEIVTRLNDAMPEGLRAISAAAPVMQPKEIMWADYRLYIRCRTAEGREALDKFFALPEIPTEKRSKKGIKTVDIKHMMQLLSIEDIENGLLVNLRCRAGVEINLNPTLALDALAQTTGFRADQVKIERYAVLTEELKDFK
ncbi:MAG: DUF2344 domain-containing protein [Oscillospiraceae bacterium]|nr:DUF2344 domain-containing protein [Oscillospiraceae bacterium]